MLDVTGNPWATIVKPDKGLDVQIVLIFGYNHDGRIAKYLDDDIPPEVIECTCRRPPQLAFHKTLAPNVYLIYARNFPKTPDNYGLIAHEVFHAVAAHFRRQNIDLTPETEETYGRHVQAFTFLVHHQIELWEEAREKEIKEMLAGHGEKAKAAIARERQERWGWLLRVFSK